MTRQSALLGFAAAIALLALTGCKGNGSYAEQYRFETPGNVEERHPIFVDKQSTGLTLRVRPGASGLSQAQQAELARFVSRYRGSSAGGLTVSAPSGSHNEIATVAALDDVQRVLSRGGVSPRSVNFSSYAAYGKSAPPIRVSFAAYAAIPPDCGAWPKDLSRDKLNRPYTNFGCATQANLAAVVANPADLVHPRGMTPVSSERRGTVWDKYIKGESTIAKKDEEEKAVASDVPGGGN